MIWVPWIWLRADGYVFSEATKGFRPEVRYSEYLLGVLGLHVQDFVEVIG